MTDIWRSPDGAMALRCGRWQMEGRRAIGSECDPKTFALAVKRLAGGVQPSMC